MSEQDEIKSKIAVLETKIDHLKEDLDNNMRAIKDLFSVQYINLEQRVKELEQHKTWLWQTIFVAVIGGIVSLILALIQ